MTFTTLDTGIKHIFLIITQQPAEIRMVHTELIETRHNPAQHFVNIVTFGNHCQLAVKSAKKTVRIHFFTCKYITTDVA